MYKHSNQRIDTHKLDSHNNIGTEVQSELTYTPYTESLMHSIDYFQGIFPWKFPLLGMRWETLSLVALELELEVYGILKASIGLFGKAFCFLRVKTKGDWLSPDYEWSELDGFNLPVSSRAAVRRFVSIDAVFYFHQLEADYLWYQNFPDRNSVNQFWHWLSVNTCSSYTFNNLFPTWAAFQTFW